MAAMVLRILIRGYQLLLSPVLPGACRFYPTCSGYAAEAVARWGALRGGWLAVKRIGRCHPWGGAGFDPVPTGYSETSGGRADCDDDCPAHVGPAHVGPAHVG